MTPAARTRANEVLMRLPPGHVIGAELGIWRGHMSAALLQRKNLTLFMVDDWREIPQYAHEGYSAFHQLQNRQTANMQTLFAAPRRHIMAMDTAKASTHFDDRSLDFVFIDADHSYAGVITDIIAWRSKIKHGGLIGGHDYDNKNYPFGPEVKAAVDSSVKKYGWTLDLGANTTWFCKVLP